MLRKVKADVTRHRYGVLALYQMVRIDKSWALKEEAGLPEKFTSDHKNQ